MNYGTSKSGSDGERRRAPRCPIDMRVRAVITSGGAPKTVHGQGTEISTIGMTLVLPIELVVGEAIEVAVAVPYCSKPLVLGAVIRGRRSFTYGLEFTKITPAQQSEIEFACRALALLT